ncbi:MAG: alginate export family protein [Desulfobulbus sp.]|jgi:alginate production protein
MKHVGRSVCLSRGGVRRARLSGFWLLCCLLGALQPSLTVGYALGSGDRKGGSVNRTFRQSGLQDNTCRFNGVEDFQMYGEVLDPELSNIGITTLAVGIRPSARSSLDLVHHLYRQDVGVSGRLPGARIRARATGKSRDLGRGWI